MPVQDSNRLQGGEQSFADLLTLNHPATLLAKGHSDFVVTRQKGGMPLHD